MPRRNRPFFLIALIVVALHAMGCSSTSRLGIEGALATNASVGTTYTSSTFTAVGGSGTYAWTITGLPPGLAASGLNSSAATVAGTPTTIGTYSVSVTLKDSSKSGTTYTGSITVAASGALTINGTLPLNGTVGTAYSGTLTATGGSGSYTWNVTGLPAGLTATNTASATVTVSGTPTNAKTYQVAIALTDSANNTAANSETIAISSSAKLSISGALADTATVGSAYSGSLTASGGSTPYSWTVSGLPAGVTATDLSSATVSIVGTPTTAGTYDISALVTDSKSATSLYTVTITVSAGDALTDGACTSKPGLRGNEANFTAPYAFVLQGADANHEPVAWAGSFTPNGSGGITAADVDAISQSFGPASYQLDLANSSYAFGADGRGCLYIAFSGVNVTTGTPAHPNVLAANVNNVLFSFTVSSAYQTGRIVESDTASSGVATAGEMHQQTPSDFALSRFGANYAFGFSGWRAADTGSLDRAAIAGSLTLAPNTGSFTNINADENVAGTASGALTGGSGALGQSISPTTGRTTGNYTITGAGGSTNFNFAAYTINRSDFFIITTDPPNTNAYLLTGRGLTRATQAPTGNFIFALSGIDFSAGSPGANNIQFGLLHLTGNQGPMSVFSRKGGMAGFKTYTETISTDTTSGRTTFSGPESNPPVLYYADADEDSIVGFLIGTDRDASSGFMAFQSNTTPNFTPLSGPFALGSAEDISGIRGSVIGTAVFSGSSVAVVSHVNAAAETAAPADQTLTGSYVVNAGGTGNISGSATAPLFNSRFVTNGVLTFSTDDNRDEPLLYISIAQSAAK